MCATFVLGEQGENKKDVLTEFRGRGDEIRVYPLSFSEYLPVYSGSETRAFGEYMTYGGLPAVAGMSDDIRKTDYLKKLFDETYLKDIIQRNHIRKDSDLEDLITILASSVGSLTNPSKLQKTFQSVVKSTITDKTIKLYIDCLLDSFLIDEARRFDIKGRRYIGSPLKYYYTDIGLRNARVGFRQMDEPHIMENIIYNELKVRGYSVDVGVVPIRVRNDGVMEARALEIDFVAYKGNNKYYVQSAFSIPSGEKKEQEERPLNAVGDSFKKLLLLVTILK